MSVQSMPENFFTKMPGPTGTSRIVEIVRDHPDNDFDGLCKLVPELSKSELSGILTAAVRKGTVMKSAIEIDGQYFNVYTVR